MNRIITLFIALLFSSLSFAQNKLDYDTDSRWFWGLNVGATWSTADVATKYKAGWGLTLGKSFNYNYGKAFSFDIRARYLGGRWIGQNTDSTSLTADNLIYKEYFDTYGHTIYNHETTINELDLELVIHANTLRARTGWDPYIFGGIGYTWYKTYGNLVDQDQFIYDYDNFSSLSSNGIISAQDNSYETALTGTSKGKVSGAFMPSLGFGLGYQLSPRFSMGLEHKTTFTLADVFDGQENSAGKRPNDWYHYTSAYMRFQIRAHVDAEIPDRNTDNTNNGYTNTVNTKPPLVNFTNPSQSGLQVNAANYIIRAKIQYVSGVENVIFRQNGNYNVNFTFNPSTQLFESNVTLNPGQNTFELTGTNTVGTAKDQTIIIYQREQNIPPVVTYTNPTTSPLTVQNPNYTVTATVVNVTSQQQVAMTLNNVPVAFSYDVTSHVATANLVLQVGSNVVNTTGTNPYGTDAKSTTIIYNPVQTVQPPVVYFVNPNVNPYNSAQNTFNIEADVLNVAGAQNITFKQNGTVNHNFVYVNQTHRLTSTVVLNPGQNVFEVIGTNSAGTAQASTIIVYNRPAPKPPIVTFTNPSVNPTETTNATFNMTATVLNVSNASQVIVKLNNQNITNFTYVAASNTVSSTLNLIEGANVVVVTGTNPDGTDTKQTTIIYRKPVTVQPPVVQFTSPNVDPYTSNQVNYTVVASVFNVTNQSGVNVTVNGSNFTGFTFANSTVTFPLTLIEGANVISITGTNTAGTASKTQTIIYRKPATQLPPVVSFIDPAVNPTTVYAPTYAVQARVRYVSAASQIELRINGQVSTNFTYSASNEIMEFTTGLVQNSNSIEIKATNSAGFDQESTIIIYKIQNPTVPPVVTITNPSSVSSTVSSASTPIAATVLNVDNQQNITVLVNGSVFPAFTYNGTTKQVNFTVTLNEGSNSISITGTNSAGQSSDARTIIYKKDEPIVPPLVTFTNPVSAGTTVSTSGFTVKATVLNVTNASQIVVMQDAQVVNPTLWSFSLATHEVTLNTNLNAGNNVFTITGTNLGGTHSATTAINYQAPVIACDKPVITLAGTSANKSALQTTDYELNFTVQGVSSSNQIQVTLNGQLQSPGTFDVATGNYSKSLIVNEGQNVIEIAATNACGQTKAITTVIYKPVEAPCLPPTVVRLSPAVVNTTFQGQQTSIQASVTNVEVASDIQVIVNAVSVPFTFDAASHIVSATIDLVDGQNTILVNVSTKCGKASTNWQILRTVCVPPTITVSSASTPDNSTVSAETFDLVAGISGVTSVNDVSVTLNGQAIGSVFNLQTGVLSFDQNLAVGANVFVITATSTCGVKTLKYTVNRKAKVVQNPPTIVISNPASTPYSVSQPGMTVTIQTGNVTASSQVSVTVNGVQTNFNFNATNGGVSFNSNFTQGANVIIATAVTPAGTATDTKTVVYTPVVVEQPPVITITSPATCPFTAPRGNLTVTGTITNISNANQVTILYNNAAVSFNSSISNNVLTFSFVINVTNLTVNLPLVITATNTAGTDIETCVISFQGNSNNGHGNNTDGNDESNPGQGSGGPNGETGGSTDDENGNGNGNGNKSGTTTTKPVVKPGRVTPAPTTPTTPQGTRVVKP